jgi:hypothetical protein
MDVGSDLDENECRLIAAALQFQYRHNCSVFRLKRTVERHHEVADAINRGNSFGSRHRLRLTNLWLFSAAPCKNSHDLFLDLCTLARNDCYEVPRSMQPAIGGLFVGCGHTSDTGLIRYLILGARLSATWRRSR